MNEPRKTAMSNFIVVKLLHKVGGGSKLITSALHNHEQDTFGNRNWETLKVALK